MGVHVSSFAICDYILIHLGEEYGWGYLWSAAADHEFGMYTHDEQQIKQNNMILCSMYYVPHSLSDLIWSYAGGGTSHLFAMRQRFHTTRINQSFIQSLKPFYHHHHLYSTMSWTSYIPNNKVIVQTNPSLILFMMPSCPGANLRQRIWMANRLSYVPLHLAFGMRNLHWTWHLLNFLILKFLINCLSCERTSSLLTVGFVLTLQLRCP